MYSIAQPEPSQECRSRAAGKPGSLFSSGGGLAVNTLSTDFDIDRKLDKL